MNNEQNKQLWEVTKKPITIIFHMISDLLAIPASKVRQFSEKYAVPNDVSQEIFRQNIFDNLTSIDESKIIRPEYQVLGQAIDCSAYCIHHEELRSMFAALIANSCNIDFSTFMHPSFPNTLKQMSPYDARLFKELAKNKEHSIDAAEYRVETDFSDNYLLLYDCIIFVDEPFDNFDMQSLSISALKQLGLIQQISSISVVISENFIHNKFFENLEKKYSASEARPIARGTQVYLTPYGESLATACSIYPFEKN